MPFQSLLKSSAAALAVLAGLSLALTGCAAETFKDGAPVASASTAAATPSPEAKKPVRAQLISFIDGDTVEVRPVNEQNGQPTGEPSFKVRMLGTTAPDASACGGTEALANLKYLIQLDEFMAVTYEPTLAESVDKDGNTLAYVIAEGGVTQDIGLRMVREGFATASYPEGKTAPKKFARYAEMGKIALDQKIGIWATCPATVS